MYLKSLKLAGFKSFADRTQLEFRPGVTVVVGPNGSGKSNLVDALSWVLGTQSTKSLRTGKMEDVIFAGTATRPSLGRAEVTLVIDNDDGAIEMDLAEVAITRRLYRDGSSDYELNGVACRLLDIQDLLSDSGVGRHQHVIIGQGEIGRVLSASPEEHRAVVEEAAGVLKHKRRQERAERRLERTDQDLLRLQDLVGEIERQMRPLRRQARVAERYAELKAEVSALRLYLGGQELLSIDHRLESITKERALLRESIEMEGQRLDGLSKEMTQLGSETNRVAEELELATSSAARLETTVERLRRVASVARERAYALTGRRQLAVERRADLERERIEILEHLDQVEAELKQAELETEATETRFRRLEDEERYLSAQSALSPEGALAAIRGEMSSLQTSLLRDRREVEGIDHRLDVLVAQRRDELAEVERIDAEVKEIDVEQAKARFLYQRAVEQRTRDQRTWSASEEALNEAKLGVAAAAARVEAIQSALTVGYDPEGRSVAEGASGALGTLISRLDVPDGMERAVDAALGRWVQAVAFEDVDVLEGAVEEIKRTGRGAVPVVPAMSETTAAARMAAAELGVEALIDRLGPHAHRGLASRFLGDVVLVEGWMTGWRLVSRHPALRAVTPEGDLIAISGIDIANPEGTGPAMLEAAEVALERAQVTLSRAESLHGSAHRDFERSRELERTALEHLESIEASLSGRTEAMGRLGRSVRALDEERARVEARREQLMESLRATEEQLTALGQRLEDLEGEEAARQRVWQELEERRQLLEAETEQTRSAWQEAASRHRAVAERRTLLRDRLGQVDAELENLGGGDLSDADPRSLDRLARLSRSMADVLREKIDALRRRQAGLRAEHEQLSARLVELQDDQRTTQAGLEEAREKVASLEVELVETRLRRESVIEAIRRDADADEHAALHAERPDAGVDADLHQLLDAKVAELGRMGPINPLAAEEYAELEERHRFLAEQMSDVESSRSELRKVITALDQEIQQRFHSAFEEVAAAYERYFGVLFPGGRGRLRLIDPQDPHTGIAIEAQPLGKRLGQMSLLSGGERSLAALAFLFAVFEARPSPFYVLDEVEAALDDANLRRFLRIVDEFRDRAQLIIITHQQQTMEAADVLYGVTMELGGSSQAVRKDMTSVKAEDVP